MNSTCNILTQASSQFSNGHYFDDFFRECALDSVAVFPSVTQHQQLFDGYQFKGNDSVNEPKLQEIEYQDPVLDFDFADQFHFLAPKVEEDWYGQSVQSMKMESAALMKPEEVTKVKTESYFPANKRRRVEYDDSIYSVPVSPSLSDDNDSIEDDFARNRIATPTRFPAVRDQRPMPNFSLVVGKQPSDGVVYKRILKPSPAVMLLEENTFMKTNRLFIDCVLVREDNGKQVDILEGNHPLPVCNGMYTIFKKLKIQETSRVHKTKFQLKFRLVQCNNQHYTPIPNVYVLSTPISVYSHSSYITKKKKNEAIRPPTIIEAMPPVCAQAGGTRCVIIGSNFVNSPKLQIKIGNVLVTPTFHESGTLVITTPYFSAPGPKRITVSNDSTNFSHSDTWLIVE